MTLEWYTQMAIPDLQHNNASATFDEKTGIAYITYRGLLNAAASTAVYDWLGDLTAAVGIENVYGEVFDFRQVQEFMPDNLMEARRSSRRYNYRHNVKRLPVAMIVRDFYQEEILRGPMENPEANPRKAIVRKMDEALAFLHEWHARNALGTPPSAAAESSSADSPDTESD